MTAAAETDETSPKRKHGTIRFLLMFAIVAWALRSFIVAPFSIPSGSMLPTMYIGDYLFVQKWPYGYSKFSFPFHFPAFEGRMFGRLPERGDIVIFQPPGREGEDWVKRVIGLPGDTVAVSDGALILNGKPVRRVETGMSAIAISPNSPCKVVAGATPMVRAAADGRPACLYPTYRETLPGGTSYLTIDQVDVPRSDDFPTLTVPEGHLFLMGDNRDDSLDSRYSPFEGGIGLVPLDHIVGRATVRFWSTDGSSSWINPISWFTALRSERLGRSYNP